MVRHKNDLRSVMLSSVILKKIVECNCTQQDLSNSYSNGKFSERKIVHMNSFRIDRLRYTFGTVSIPSTTRNIRK